jgi:hypothetical protein
VNTDATGLGAAMELENRNQVLSHATDEAAARRIHHATRTVGLLSDKLPSAHAADRLEDRSAQR